MAKTEIDELQISITADTKAAVSAYKSLAKSLKALQKMSNADFGFANLSKQVNEFARSSSGAIGEIQKLGTALEQIGKNARFLSNEKTWQKMQARAMESVNAQHADTLDVTLGSGDDNSLDEAKMKTEKNLILDLGDAAEKSGKQAKHAATGWEKFTKNIANIVKYRIVRSIISGIGQSAKEGSDNLYAFLEISNDPQLTELKDSLDQISNTFLQLKNTIGITFLTTVNALSPAINVVCQQIMQLSEAITIFISYLKGQDYYLRVTEESLAKWSKAAHHAVQGFDELNVLAGTGTQDPSLMFEKAEMEEGIELMVEEAKKLAILGLLYAGIKRLISQVTGGFNNKNSSLKTQTERVGADAKATEGLESILALLGITAFGAFEIFNKANKDNVLDPEPAGELAGAFEGLEDKLGALDASTVTDLGTAIDGMTEDSTIKINGLITAIEGVASSFEATEQSVGKSGSLTNEHLQTVADKFGELGIAIQANDETAKEWKVNMIDYARQSYGAVETMVTKSNSQFDNMITKIGEVKLAYEEMIKTMGDANKDTVTVNGSGSPVLNNSTVGSQSALLNPYSSSNYFAFGNGTNKESNSPLSNFSFEGMVDYWGEKFQKVFADYETRKISQEDWLSRELPDILSKSIGFWFASIATMFSGSPVPGFAGGGFVSSADVFTARENGIPEMVGRIGSRTAVANNDQITSAIASAVYDAITSANQQGGTSVNVVLEGDAKGLFKAVQKEARSYTKMTGNVAW